MTVDPSADTTKMSDCSSTPAVVASRDPSGDQSGQRKVSVNVDSRRASDPSGSTTCNVNVAELWKAMTPPFGAQAGSMPSSDGSVIWIAPDRPSRATMMLVPAPTSAAKAMRVLSGDQERLLGWFSDSSRTLSVIPSARTSRSCAVRIDHDEAPRSAVARAVPEGEVQPVPRPGRAHRLPARDEHITLGPVGQTDDDALRGIDGDQPRAGQPERWRRPRGARRCR